MAREKVDRVDKVEKVEQSNKIAKLRTKKRSERDRLTSQASHTVMAERSSRKTRSLKSKKSKRNSRPPRAVRLSQSERRFNPPPVPRAGVSVTVNIGRPRIPTKLASRLPKLVSYVRSDRRTIPVVLVLVAVLVIGVTVLITQYGHHKPAPASGKGATAERTAPDFKPLVPSEAETTASTYDGKRNMVSYSTTFSGARLTVSQQPLPARLRTDPKALSAAADSIHADQKLETAKGPIYIATNKTNDQLAVYAGPQVLLFIHTDRKLDDASWKSFIELLKTK